MNIGTNLRQLRISLGKTQEEICKLCGFKQGNYTGWETNKYIPNADSLIKLADCFGCSVDYLLGRESEDGTIIINSSANTLNAEENSMIKKFRILNKRRKELAICYLNGLYDGQLKDNIGG